MPDLIIAQLEKRAGKGETPLFARLAGLYLDKGRAQDALTLLDAGLASYPYYVTAHLVKGRVLMALNMPTEARRELEWVSSFMPGNAAVARLLEQVPPGPDESVTAPSADSGAEFSPASGGDTYGTETTFADGAAPTPAEFGFAVPSQDQSSDAFGTFGLPAEPPAAAPQSLDALFGLPPAPPPAPALSNDFGVPAADVNSFDSLTSFSPEAQANAADAFSPFSGPTGQEAAPFDFGTPAAPAEDGVVQEAGESFDQYAARMRTELVGENTITFDDYLGSPSAPAEPPPAASDFDDLAQKLQSAKRITPAPEPPPAPAFPATPIINLSTKSVTTATESETPASTGFVTPTLAEIYAKQGWYDDAIKAYKTLATNKPADRDRFLKRIEELEAMKKQQGG